MLRCRNRVDSYPSRRPTAGRAFSVTVKLAVSLAGIIALTRSWQLGLSILSQRGSEVIDTLLLLPHALHGARRSLPVEAGRATAAAGWRGKRRHSREVGAGSCAAPSKARTNQEVAGQPCSPTPSHTPGTTLAVVDSGRCCIRLPGISRLRRAGTLRAVGRRLGLSVPVRGPPDLCVVACWKKLFKQVLRIS